MREWHKIKLGSEVKIRTGFPFKSAAYSQNEHDIRLLRGDNIVQGSIRWDDVKRWPANNLEDFKDYLLEQGDVVLAMDRPWIEAGLKQACIDSDDLPCLQVQRTARLQGSSILITPYLRYIIASPWFTEYIKRINTGSSIPHISSQQIRDFEIPIPSVTVQNKIANFLSVIDLKIKLNNQINSELESMAKLIYDYWFVQFDFLISAAQAKAMGRPELEGKPYKSSGGKMVRNGELRRDVPEGWEVKELGDYALIKKGKLITEKTADTSGRIKVVSAGLDYSYFHSEANYPENTITISASGASAGFINFWREPIFACDCTTVRGHSTAQTLQILGFLNMRQDYIYQQARGSAQPHVYPKDIEGLKIARPPKELVESFGNLVIASNETISNNLKQNQELTSLRDWLLPMLMNGQVRVREDEGVRMAAEPREVYKTKTN